MSVRETLKVILSCKSAVECLEWPREGTATTYKHALDCKHLRAIAGKLPSDCLPLFIELYYDDFEIANPLGTKRLIYKMGAFYYTIKNMPNYFNSNSANIHLLAIGHMSEFMVCDYMQHRTCNICTYLWFIPGYTVSGIVFNCPGYLFNANPASYVFFTYFYF